jgi:HlyD family secretion protein
MLKKLGQMLKKRRVPLIVVLFLLAAGAAAVILFGKKSGAGDYITAKVDRGPIEVDVSATGTVSAVVTVQVGSQVSGTIAWLGADFKSRVKAGQLLAKLDPAIFQAQVDQQKANVANTQAAVQAAATDINNQIANVAAAKANADAARVQRDDSYDIVKRDRELVNVIASRDIQAAEAAAKGADARVQQAEAQIGQAQAQLNSSKAKLDEAKAAVKTAQALYDLANTNLHYSIIASPIDGVVVSRNVDVGQTVAASLQAPTLFTIANDLKNMQVLASIDEADVGQIREGITANFTVDAYQGATFSGQISQIRLNAQTLQNVVTYTAVINVANPDEKLMPGMTANIVIPVAKRDDVLMVPNAALRFKPNLTDQEQQEVKAKLDARRQQRDAASQPQGGQPADTQGAAPSQGSQSGGQPVPGGQPAPGAQPAAQGGGKPGAQSGGRQGQVIYLLGADKKLDPRFVRLGITNGRSTEVSGGDINEGDIVVIGQNDATGAKTQQPASPLGARPPGGGPGGGGPGRGR